MRREGLGAGRKGHVALHISSARRMLALSSDWDYPSGEVRDGATAEAGLPE